jgi:hypothetical protein
VPRLDDPRLGKLLRLQRMPNHNAPGLAARRTVRR